MKVPKGGRKAESDPPEDEEEDDPECFDMLDVVNGMATHFHEKRMDILTTWSWKLFVNEWAILIDDVSKEKERDEKREWERNEQRMQHEVESAHYRGLME